MQEITPAKTLGHGGLTGSVFAGLVSFVHHNFLLVTLTLLPVKQEP